MAPNCLYCDRRLEMALIHNAKVGDSRPVLDHLDNNENNDRYNNLALAHQKCSRARHTNHSYQLVALQKLSKNMTPATPPSGNRPVRGSMRKSRLVHTLTRDCLKRKVHGVRTISCKELCDDVAYQLNERYGFGNSKTVEQHVGVLCSSLAPWQIKNVGGKKIISRRVGAVMAGDVFGRDRPSIEYSHPEK